MSREKFRSDATDRERIEGLLETAIDCALDEGALRDDEAEELREWARAAYERTPW